MSEHTKTIDEIATDYAQIRKVLEDKFEHRKDEDEYGFTGHFKLSPKEVLDVIIELREANGN
jgi:hypothetical protein